MNNNKLIRDLNGQRMEFDIYFTFVSYQTNRGYIAYTDHTLNEQGREIIHIGAYDPNVGFDQLVEVESQEEKDLVYNVIDQIIKIS